MPAYLLRDGIAIVGQVVCVDNAELALWVRCLECLEEIGQEGQGRRPWLQTSLGTTPVCKAAAIAWAVVRRGTPQSGPHRSYPQL